MFKVEKKFILTREQKDKLLEGAKFLGEKKFKDTYYDNEKFSLGMNDIWLRKREEKFYLKIPVCGNQEEFTDKYHKIEGEMAIREIFAIPVIGTFEDDLKSFGHEPFSIFETIRRKYKKDGFIIYLDKADFGDWQYVLAKIELLIESKDQVKDAEKEIDDFCSRFGLKTEHINGKSIEFIKRKIPEVYEKMKEDGIAY